MQNDGAFNTIAGEITDEIVVKGSRFIAHAQPANDRVAAESYIEVISGRYQDATHNCFAYRIGLGDRAIFRFEDAGEPSGTAGRPILQACETKEVTNLAVVVTRYFGGTKLGTGGLIRAYSGAALAALNKARIVIHHRLAVVTLQAGFAFTNAVHQMVERYNAKILDTQFDEAPIYRVQLKAADKPSFTTELKDLASGQVVFFDR